MSNKQNHDKFTMPQNGFYLGIMLFFVLIICFFNWMIAIPCFLILGALFYYTMRNSKLRLNEVTRYIEDLSLNLDNATKGTMRYFPLPLVVIRLDGSIVWYNQDFKALVNQKKLFDKNISELIESISSKELLENRVKYNFEINDVQIEEKTFDLIGTIVKSDAKTDLNDYIIIIYFIEKTNLVDLQHRYQAEQSAIGIVIFDNYDDLMATIEESAKPQLLAAVEGTISNWLTPHGGVLRKYERDKYLFIFESIEMDGLLEKKFDILDLVKDLGTGSDIPATLSIGFGIRNGSIADNFEAARSAIDIALGRGGDQVVLKDGEEFKFFGGKTKEVEKRTKIKSRVVAGVIKDLMRQSDQIFIMGHEGADLDALGASIGFWRMAKLVEKDARIVFGDVRQTVKTVVGMFQKRPEYSEMFVGNEEALSTAGDNTLLIVVDTHRPSITQCPKLLDICKKIVVVDHHRKGTEFIQNATINYQEPYASSACELVAEILQYADDKIKLPKLEAESLYAGIVVDTKNFTVKTGVRTFEVATFLRRNGVDPVAVSQFFQHDIVMYTTLAAIVSSAEITPEGIAVAMCPSNTPEAQLVSASAADQLLNLSGITAAFVLSDLNGVIHISGRSYGDINVQMILETLGGGGHQTVAGAQLENTNMNDAKILLSKKIEEYVELLGQSV
ncbi:MAG: DHH family phosphoesterase [Clostridia bacterium]